MAFTKYPTTVESKIGKHAVFINWEHLFNNIRKYMAQ